MELDTTLKQKLRKRFPAKPVLAISGCLTLLGSIWSSALLTRAASADYSVQDAEVTLDGTSDGTVTVPVVSTALRYYTAIQADWSLSELDPDTEAGPYLTLTGMKRETSYELPYNPTTGTGIWAAENAVSRLPVVAYDPVFSATYTVDKDTPAGKYIVSVSNILLNYEDESQQEYEEDTMAFLSEITVSRSSSADPGTTDPDPGTTDPDPGVQPTPTQRRLNKLSP